MSRLACSHTASHSRTAESGDEMGQRERQDGWMGWLRLTAWQVMPSIMEGSLIFATFLRNFACRSMERVREWEVRVN